jgi:hypothetical protein
LQAVDVKQLKGLERAKGSMSAAGDLMLGEEYSFKTPVQSSPVQSSTFEFNDQQRAAVLFRNSTRVRGSKQAASWSLHARGTDVVVLLGNLLFTDFAAAMQGDFFDLL